MAGLEYESVLCVKPTVHVFRIPPRSSNRGYRAADWKLDQPDWSGRLRIVAKGKDLAIKLEDKNSGELFAKCPVEQYPGIAVEAVNDSSRYFVLRIMDDNGRSAFIGIGFEDRGDSFDLNVALQDHFKHLRQEKEAEKSDKELDSAPKLDLGFKEGQTIRINIATKKNPEETTVKRNKPKPMGGGGMGLLPPPPGTGKLASPGGAGLSLGTSESQNSSNAGFATFTNTPVASSHSNTSNPAGNTSSGGTSNVDLLLDLGDFSAPSSSGQVTRQSANQPAQGHSSLEEFDLFSSVGESSEPVKPMGGPIDPWGDFASASSNKNDISWVQF